MGTDRDCSPEVIGLIAFFEASGVPGRITSTFRPGAVTKAGNASRHGRKLAVDFAGSNPGRDTAELGDIFALFAPFAGHLNELIYAGPQAERNVKRGHWVKKYAQDLHHDHVHVAVEPGVVFTKVAPTQAHASEEIIDDMDGREDMTEPVDAVASPQGGVWVLTRDGGVRTYDQTGATPFHGSYPGLPPEAKQGGLRTFVHIRRNDRGGYDLISSGGEVYSFPL